MVPTPGSFDQRSFRDPAGSLYLIPGRVLRGVRSDAAGLVRELLASPWVLARVKAGQLIATSEVDGAELDSPERFELVLEHEVVPFPSHPAEWPAQMLLDAGELTLDLAEEALGAGLGLKDATPLNILFRGPRPVFVDFLSFEKRDAGDPTWRPYAQFVRTFLLPLLAHRRAGLPIRDVFLARRDGLDPRALRSVFRGLNRFRPSVVTHVLLADLLSRLPAAERASAARSSSDPDRARFVLNWNLRRLRKALVSQSPKRSSSAWSAYEEENSYSEAGAAAKEAFVRRTLESRTPLWVLDVGTNRGRHALLAAGTGARVVAIDSDPVVIGDLWAQARLGRQDVLPLVVDLARPTPSLGWRNREFASFLDRARGNFQGVLLLAVLHHLLVSEGIPLAEIIGLCHELTTDFAVIEFVPPQDPMFRTIARGRDAQYSALTQDVFERAVAGFFRVAAAQDIPGSSRRIYLLTKSR